MANLKDRGRNADRCLENLDSSYQNKHSVIHISNDNENTVYCLRFHSKLHRYNPLSRTHNLEKYNFPSKKAFLGLHRRGLGQAEPDYSPSSQLGPPTDTQTNFHLSDSLDVEYHCDKNCNTDFLSFYKVKASRTKHGTEKNFKF